MKEIEKSRYEKFPPLIAEYMERVLEQIKASGKDKPSDIIAMDILANDLQMWYQANEEVKQFGITFLNDKGRRTKNPAIDVANSSLRRAIGIMQDYGLTALSRKKLEKGEVQDEEHSPLEEFLLSQGK